MVSIALHGVWLLMTLIGAGKNRTPTGVRNVDNFNVYWNTLTDITTTQLLFYSAKLNNQTIGLK